MPSGQTLHKEAIKFYTERGFMSQKDLMRRRGFNSVRSVQRFRAKYGLKPSGYWGINPLFDVDEVLAAEKRELKDKTKTIRRATAHATRCRLMDLKQAKRKARK